MESVCTHRMPSTSVRSIINRCKEPKNVVQLGFVNRFGLVLFIVDRTPLPNIRLRSYMIQGDCMPTCIDVWLQTRCKQYHNAEEESHKKCTLLFRIRKLILASVYI
jgi:hypothetical protein